MRADTYQFRSDVACPYIGLGMEEGRREGRVEGRREGRQEGRVGAARAAVIILARRHGDPGDEARRRVAACTDLHRLVIDLATAPDADDAAALARLPARP